MASLVYMPKANSPSLKRSFTIVEETENPNRGTDNIDRSTFKVPAIPQKVLQRDRRMTIAERPRLYTDHRSVKMPVQTSSRPFLAPLPSFMSVFGEGANMRILEEDSPSRQTSSYPAADLKATDNHFLLQHQHQHRDSISTSNSESTESSPTTTISTMDSSMSEPSSTSSPESPLPSMPLSHTPLRNRGDQSPEGHATTTLPHPLSKSHRPHSPAKRARNTKNLSLNMSATTRPSSQPARTSTAAGFSPSLSAPPSPSFIVPPKPPKRRPSKLGLTIMTPGIAGEHNKSIMPPTPSISRPNKLRHFQSSPSLSAFSPTAAPEGGMHFPAFNNERGFGRFSKPKQHAVRLESSFNDPDIPPKVAARLEELEEENDEVPLSHEAKKSPAYPSGPVCIYDPLVYLYLEPSDIEASEFDVILNVAREVKNPFTLAAEKRDLAAAQASSKMDQFTKGDHIDEKDSGISGITASSASFEPEQTDSNATSPSTPKAKKPPPEYIHIPWDHNTNIVDDLLKLVELIDDRVKRGKRILVHCQCGVSRSASLIVAYGLYKNPKLSVQQAYDAVKQRSRWIGPNMNLIYQLSEFKNKLSRTMGASSHAALRARRNVMAGRSNSVSHGNPSALAPLSGSFADDNQPEPQSAPLPAERDRNSMGSPPLSPTAPQLAISRDFDSIVPAPLTAPSQMQPRDDRSQSYVGSWPPASNEDLGFLRSTVGEGAYSIPKGHNVEPSGITDSQSAAPAPSAFTFDTEQSRSRPFGLKASHVPPNDVDQTMFDAPPTPTLLSPRAAEFTASPFHRTGLGEMRPSTFNLGGLASPKMFDEDPRSPAQRGEAPITRNIFDVL
ncbi:MAG: hypothetical protein M1819_006109 [Sarea resinae]|nr:MAG: hypothetical protein M1819_006109 [Sarea resinae]